MALLLACSLLGALPPFQAARLPGFLRLEPALPRLPDSHPPRRDGTVAGDGPPQHFMESFFLRYGASADSFSSSFNTNTNRSCTIIPGAFTADPQPLPDCREQPFAWEVGGVVRIQCPEPIRWIEEGHEVLVNQGFSGKQVFNMEKDNPVWERLNYQAWRSGTPGRLRHTTEFLEVRCGARRQLFVRLRPRAAVAARALRPPDPPGPAPGRRPDIVVLVVDAVSRASFMHLCPQTAALLRSFALGGTQASHRAFVFHHAAALGPYTAFNMIPLFAGLPFTNAHERQRMKTMILGRLPAGHRWVWDEAQAVGYATAYISEYGCLFGHRFWNNSFDHLMPGRLGHSQMPFWAKQGYNCLGGRPFSDLDFDYAHAFLEEPLYAALPKFLYVHLDQAHDRQTRAAWLDAPLATAVKRILRTQPHSVVLLLSDHGGTPVYLPLVSLLVPSSLVATYPDWGSSLHANQDEVVSWYDLHVTLRHLLHPDHPPPSLPTLPTAHSLLSPMAGGTQCAAPTVANGTATPGPPPPGSQAARSCSAAGGRPTRRSCRGAGVPAAFCPCMRATRVPPGSPLLAGAAAALLADWNRLIPAGSPCLPLKLNRVISGREITSGPANNVRHFDLLFTVQGDSYPVFALQSNLHRRNGHYVTTGATQQTRYERYRQCADPRVELTYCVCRLPPGNLSSSS